jgi:hypothetical protein
MQQVTRLGTGYAYVSEYAKEQSVRFCRLFINVGSRYVSASVNYCKD